MARIGWRVGTTLAVLFLAACALAAAAEDQRTVVMLGDSTTLCSRSRPGHKVTDQVQSNLAHSGWASIQVVNAGKGSDTIKGAYQRLERDVFPHDPDVVTISFGLNDTGKLSPEEFRSWLGKTIEAIQGKTKAKLLLVTSTPFNNERHAWGTRFADKGGLDEYMDANICAVMRETAKQRGVSLCDLHAHFKADFKKDAGLIERLIRQDGVHLTEEGDAVAARYLSPMVRDLLAGRTDSHTNTTDASRPGTGEAE